LVFPCIDEPDVKAIFDITLEHDLNLMSLSNMPEEKVEILSNNTKRTKFMCTPLMSTYLVALIVGEFDYIQATTKRGTLVRVITPIGRASAGEFALDCAIKALET
jgi:puromycin-sensitive aminopeptidase